MAAHKSRTTDPDEIRHFAKDSAHWWDETGPFAPLHRLNPVRMGFIRDVLAPDAGGSLRPLSGLKILDIGCGGGLVSEPLARMGADVTGLDADDVAIGVARDHADANGLDIRYLNDNAEDLAGREPGAFDCVVALEIVEHVADIDLFIAAIARLCRPGGTVIMSTLNRTPKSFALGIVAAEYILRWVPTGTHDWKKFVKPAELAAAMRRHGLSPERGSGLIFNPLTNSFSLSKRDLDVNYLMVAHKPETKKK